MGSIYFRTGPIIGPTFILFGVVFTGLAFFYFGRLKKSTLLKVICILIIGIGALYFSWNFLHIFSPWYQTPVNTGYEILIAVFGLLFGIYRIKEVDSHTVEKVTTGIFALSASGFAFFSVLLPFIHIFLWEILDDIYVLLTEILVYLILWVGLGFLLLTIMWFVRLNVDELASQKNLALRDELIKASKVYTRIPYKKLAKNLNCSEKELLSLITDMINENKISASIEEPDVLFKSH